MAPISALRAAASLGLSLSLALATLVTVHNDVPRVDQFGDIVNAHDGSVVKFGGVYFLYGTVYENCTQHGTQCEGPCGYSPNTYALYTSYDLQSWTVQSYDILPSADRDNRQVNYWMPYVGFNKLSNKYAMQFWSGHCGFAKPCTEIAYSFSPYGPFTNVTTIALAGTPSSQMGFFADDDGTAYVKYNTVGPDQHHNVERLNADWTASTGEWAVLFWKPSFAWMEGGGMFSRMVGGKKLYYYMTGTDCCFCTWGGDARFWTSWAPLGPWHPGVAPPLPTERCDLTGSWHSVRGSPDAPSNETLTLTQAADDSFVFQDAKGKAAGSIDQATGFVTFGPSAGDHRGVVTSSDGKAAGCDRVRWYGYESFTWCRDGADCAVPSYADAPEVNLCADGSQPHEDVRVNPCDPDEQYGTNFTVPAQQFNVIIVEVSDGAGGTKQEVLYYGERANSTPDGNFSHNFQAWVPLQFDDAGAMLPMTFPASFQLDLANATAAVEPDAAVTE
jgi:hypothetical protein